MSNGFRFLDAGPLPRYRYDDQQLIETVDWLAGLSLNKGIAPPFAESVERSSGILFMQGEDEVDEIMMQTLDEIFLGTAVAAKALPAANEQINALFMEN